MCKPDCLRQRPHVCTVALHGLPPAAVQPCITEGNYILGLYTTYRPSTVFPVLLAFLVGLHILTYALIHCKVKKLAPKAIHELA